MALIGDPANFLTLRSTTYIEADESPTGAYSFDRGQVTRSIFTAWADRDQAALDFAGTAVVVTNTDGRRYISRTLPHALPSKTHMRVQSVPQVKPMGLRGNDGGQVGGLSIARYEMAEVVLQYGMPTYDFLEDADVEADDGTLEALPDEGWHLANNGAEATRFISRTMKFTTRELVLNRGMLKTEDQKLVLEGIPIREATGEITYTHHMVPADAIPTDAWIAGGSTVNEFEFDGWPVGTLLAHSMPEMRPEPNVIDGQKYYSLSYKFQLLMLYDRTRSGDTVIRGHNYIRKLVSEPPELPRFKPLLVTTDGGDGTAPGTLMFPLFDFQQFFRPNQP